MDIARQTRLTRLLDSVVRGRQALNRQNSSLFLEAICVQSDPVSCVDKLVVSQTGLQSLQTALFMDLSAAFMNGIAAQLFHFLQAPELKDIGGGVYLNQIVLKIAEPSIFWRAYSTAFLARQLEDMAQVGFAWMLLQLVSLPGDPATPYLEQAKTDGLVDRLVESSHSDVRSLGHKVKHVMETRGQGATLSDHGPGGRHDNDFVDFREIAILPTADEIICKEPPFILPAHALDEVDMDQRLPSHLANQFRLLREDMLEEMREELQIALGKKKGNHRGLKVQGLSLLDICRGPDNRGGKWGITLKCKDDFWFFIKDKPKDRKKYLQDNRRLVKHQSLACLLVDGNIVAFPTIDREEDLLAQKPPVFLVHIDGRTAIMHALNKLLNANDVALILIDTAVFAFEPVLKALQDTTSMPLSPELLCWTKDTLMSAPQSAPMRIINALRANPRQDLRDLLQLSKSVVLDSAQAASLLSGLTQRVSLIQGPPGTGKSFIGAILAKALHDSTAQTILVCCYTNHALDQFLEDLLNIGIPSSSLVRLGGKATAATEPLSLYNQKRTTRLGQADWKVIDGLKVLSNSAYSRLETTFQQYKAFNITHEALMTHLEFDDPDYHEAFIVPSSAIRDSDGMRQVGRRGHAINEYYLLDRWLKGLNPGLFMRQFGESEIWQMAPNARREVTSRWRTAILTEQVEAIYDLSKIYSGYQTQLQGKFAEGCTTTAAAKYSETLRAASPNVLLVEEAGEILESHVLTALGSDTKQLILIGDHKQLRPKVNNYLLTVEKGEGYDLNRSLFERLVLQGYPHETLNKQHRMRPEIAALIRHLTYPDLVDANGTKNRPDLRGVRDNVVFIDHAHPEDENPKISDMRDMGSKSSKQNTHEVLMVLKILRYLAQQGYGTDRVVILTPYLGQLHKLQDALKKDNDPILNDLDSFDLVRAGLLPPAAAKVNKKPIRLATIDNYQGEESDIVIVSLTRSNVSHDIGFMFAPERLNVLLSRARDALIMIGNSETFMKARKGNEIWTSLFNMLRRDSHIYDGFPVKCERHPDRTANLKKPADFDEESPDGGCKMPCNSMLNCGLHTCPSKCHQLYDHSKMECEHIMSANCSQGLHRQSWKCHKKQPLTCPKCEKEVKAAEKRQKEAFELQQRRDAEQLEHAKKLAELDEQIEAERQAQKDADLVQERVNALRQKKLDLEAARAQTLRKASAPPPQAPVPSPSTQAPSPPRHPASPPPATPSGPSVSSPSAKVSPPTVAMSGQVDPPALAKPSEPSPSQSEWQRQKDMEGAQNPHIDSIMEMVGLEQVKAQVLAIKNKIDVTLRQGTSVKDERFNVVLLGNPGTGKTTVARHYAKFLTSLDVLPGDTFVETTGSRLANDGIPGIKKQIESVLSAGGGAIFVDEAYQLTSEGNFGGGPVLDFLLAEMENNVGKIVFILAGYNKQMEKFFEHNPGLTSRVPYRLQFSDYTDDELLAMLEKRVHKKYAGRMKVQGGIRGLHGRIAVRRLGRGRGREGFGNARALENMFNKVTERQANRIAKERKEGRAPDDLLMVGEDLIGPDPAEAIVVSSAWKKLKALTGLTTVKESIQNLFDLINTNYRRELQEKEPVQVSLNRVFLGSPGTGKTTVANLYGQVLADLGLLSNGEVVLKNPADFVGNVLGQSESNTKAILATTVGKVLVIDEAYMLYGASGNGKQNDPFKTAVIDTIVAEVQSVPGEDRCVLMLGYEEQMREMFQNVNPGLSRRFAIEDAFHFHDFNDAELLEILNLKLKQQDLAATDAAKAIAINVLGRSRNRPNFGNGGEVENLLSKAKGQHQARHASLAARDRPLDIVFEPQDFDADFDRDAHSADNLKELFKDVIGCEKVVEKLEEYQNIARVMKAQGKELKDARGLIPTNFVFKGPPGTGKTTTARKMGKVYFDMGFLSSTEVVECSASDLVGEYVGQTGPKTQRLFNKALGKVLFIDEAYRLSEGHFAKEAIDELVGTLTQEAYMSKLVVILAGYDQDMNQLMAVNTGLSSRFPEVIVFENMSPEHCLKVLNQELKKRDIHSQELEEASSPEYKQMVQMMQDLSSIPSWGNARDVQTLSKGMVRAVFRSIPPDASSSKLTLNPKDALACMAAMLKERQERARNVPNHLGPRPPPPLRQLRPSPPSISPPSISTAQAHTTKAAAPKPATGEDEDQPDGRDMGVTDAVWNQLQADKQAVIDALKRREEEQRVLTEALEKARKEEEDRKKAQRVLEEVLKRKRDAETAVLNEIKRRLEEQRLRELAARAERDRLIALQEERRRQEVEEKRREAQAQQKLRTMGVCVAGFQWIKQASGYRCAGGTHFVSDAQLGL
ncbi:P-loop containing nucleoside triphosphate hydrolase protein [Artomyces pyxidatus]|uniref:P-loop containing nucleoside triphosphate hydrolase protein n=1 Tax=Artomyces pyxidatus TaxID=48021 RepID=A0ACB8TFF5_9AGAM|nr:P-loop containing nucleoside triphosphate hydrolase protein [Artomyces pyxidatus]